MNDIYTLSKIRKIVDYMMKNQDGISEQLKQRALKLSDKCIELIGKESQDKDEILNILIEFEQGSPIGKWYLWDDVYSLFRQWAESKEYVEQISPYNSFSGRKPV